MPTSTQRFRLVGDDDASRAFLEVAAAARLLKSNMDDVSGSVLGLAKLSGGASLLPVLAATTAAAAELTTALGAAAGAGGIFGLSVVGQVKSMVEQRKAITTTDKTLSKLIKGTSTYRETLATLHQQQKTFNQDFGPAAKGFDQMQSSWTKFLDATKPVTNGVLAKGFDLVSDALPKLVPVSNAAGQAVGGLIDDLDGWVNGPGFAHLLHFLETSGPKDITRFGHSIGNVLGGLGGILENFVGPGNHAAKTLEHLTADFDRWGHSKGVSDSVNRFLNFVGSEGPEITSALQAMAQATPKIATSLGRLGSANLTVTSRFLNLIAGLPQGAFDVVVDGLFAIAAGSRAITAVTGIKAILTGLGGVASGKGLLGKASGTAASSLGIQKVFVVNMGQGGLGPGGIPGESGIPGGAAGKAGIIGTLSAASGGAALALGLLFGGDQLAKAEGKSPLIALPAILGVAVQEMRTTNKLIQNGFNLNHAIDRVPTPGPLTENPTQIGPKMFGGQVVGQKATADLKATGTAVDALRANLGKASAAMDLVGHSADRAFPNATKRVIDLSGKLETIKGSKAAAALDLVGHSAAANFARAGGDVDTFKGKLDAVSKVTPNLSRFKSSLGAQLDQAGGIARSGGAGIGASLAAGIHSSLGGALASIGSAAAALVNHAIAEARKAADAHSPSRKMQQLGDDMGAGLALGISSSSEKVVKATQATVKAALDAAKSDMHQLSSGVADALRSDLFSDTNAFGKTGSPISTLKADIANAKAFKSTLRALSHEGVSGQAFAAIASSGNLQAAQALAGNKREARQFQHLFVERQHLTGSVGREAGQTVFGDKITEDTRLLRSIDHRLAKLPKETGKETAKAVNGPVKKSKARARTR